MCSLYASYDAELVRILMQKSGPALIKLAKESYAHKYELYLALATKKTKRQIKDAGRAQSAINALKFWLEEKVDDSQMRALSQKELDRIYSTKKIVTSSNGNEFRNHALGAC